MALQIQAKQANCRRLWRPRHSLSKLTKPTITQRFCYYIQMPKLWRGRHNLLKDTTKQKKHKQQPYKKKHTIGGYGVPAIA